MKLPYPYALALQEQLQFIAITSNYAIEFISGFGLRDEQNDRWQLAVDTIHRLLASGLIYEAHNEDELSVITQREYLAYVNALAQKDPFAYPLNMEWMEWDLYATDRCKKLLNKYGISTFYEGGLVEPFIEEVEALFTQHGVPWQDSPIIPIRG